MYYRNITRHNSRLTVANPIMYMQSADTGGSTHKHNFTQYMELFVSYRSKSVSKNMLPADYYMLQHTFNHMTLSVVLNPKKQYHCLVYST